MRCKIGLSLLQGDTWADGASRHSLHPPLWAAPRWVTLFLIHLVHQFSRKFIPISFPGFLEIDPPPYQGPAPLPTVPLAVEQFTQVIIKRWWWCWCRWDWSRRGWWFPQESWKRKMVEHIKRKLEEIQNFTKVFLAQRIISPFNYRDILRRILLPPLAVFSFYFYFIWGEICKFPRFWAAPSICIESV